MLSGLGREGDVVQAEYSYQAGVMLVHVPLQDRSGTAAGYLLQSLQSLPKLLVSV